MRRHPVLTIGAVKVAAQHAEAIGESAGIGVEKWFLLDRVTLGAGGVSPWNVEGAAAVVADFADAGLAFGDGTAVATGVTADPAAIEFFVEPRVGYADSTVEDVAQGRHRL